MKINECTSGLLKDASIQITQHFQASYAKTRQSSSCLKKEEAAKGQKKKKKTFSSGDKDRERRNRKVFGLQSIFRGTETEKGR